MSNVMVKPVVTRAERKRFLELPWRLYRGDPNWVPPLRMDQAEMVGYRHHPFFERNRAQTFLATRDGEVCGRVAAILNRDHLDRHADGRGFFGFFECVDDQKIANALFDAVRDWLAAQGIERVRGPMSPGLNYVPGLLVEGFDSPPTIMMAYNPASYERLIEGYGFQKVQDLYAFHGHRSQLDDSSAKLEPISQQIVERYNVRIRPINRRRFVQDVEAFIDLYNQSMDGHWGFTPMSKAEVRHLAGGLKWLIVPELAVAAEIEGKLVGACFALLDYNPRIKLIDGRLFPFGLVRLLWNRRQIKKVRLMAANVLPEYQMMGIGLVLLRSITPMGTAWGLEECEYSWVAESNRLSRGSLEKGGANRVKTYRVYDWGR
ncbi:MAG: N-acetyltransferase [Planctomycetia bacterium]|nr:N-acetyltransferase [Planctomycetia bacterium]